MVVFLSYTNSPEGNYSGIDRCLKLPLVDLVDDRWFQNQSPDPTGWSALWPKILKWLISMVYGGLNL